MYTISYETNISENSTAKVLEMRFGALLEIVYGPEIDIYLIDKEEICTSKELVSIRVIGYKWRPYKN